MTTAMGISAFIAGLVFAAIAGICFALAQRAHARSQRSHAEALQMLTAAQEALALARLHEASALAIAQFGKGAAVVVRGKAWPA